MRVIYFLIQLLLLGAIGVFALQNGARITHQYLNWSVSLPSSICWAW
jgi:uncharacterized integral membrane protein